MLIFDHSMPGRRAYAQSPATTPAMRSVPAALRRKAALDWPQVSELQVVRHYTRLSQKNFSIDTHFYPLGSCTMKYNPRACNKLAMLPEFLARHPLAPVAHGQGFLACMHDLQEMLKEVTGMQGVSLTPMAGAQGELAGVLMIRAYHRARGDAARTEILVPDAAHGTNPATAVMCGLTVREIPTDRNGDVDMDALKAAVGPQTAGIMLTNPSTLGVFERRIKEISQLVHDAGGLLYYDGANLNAILGKVRPGDMGFDVIHMNLHKTFSTPHGGGGPGAGAVGVGKRLLPFMPTPVVGKDGDRYRWLTERDLPQSIGRLSAFMGNAGVLLRAFVYARLLGRTGMSRVADFATLNANYLMVKLRDAGFELAFPARRASHEFIVTLKREAKETGLTAMDMAKRLLDYGFHAPTTYFPLLVPECLLIEPTETETRADIDAFVDAMVKIREEARNDIAFVKGAPYTMPVRRLDDVRAARQLDLVWRPDCRLMSALICGSYAYDTIMVFGDRFQRHILPDQVHMLNVSFLVPELRREFGGCAGNVAYNLKLLGGEAYGMGTVGHDFGPYAQWLDAQGISRKFLREVPAFTAQAYITTDVDDNQITAFHPGAMSFSHENAVPRDAGITIGMVSPDGREGMLQHAEQFADAGIPFIFDPGQGLPMFDGAALGRFIDLANWVAVNSYEAAMLCERTGLSREDIAARCEALIVTAGGDGATIYADGEAIVIPAAKANAVVDPTGCGDAFRAGLLYGLMHDCDWETTGRIASLLGAIKIEHPGTQNHAFTRPEFNARYETEFGTALR